MRVSEAPSKRWQRTTTFSRNDLPLVAKVADHCHTLIHEVRKNDRLYHACSKSTAKWFSHTKRDTNRPLAVFP